MKDLKFFSNRALTDESFCLPDSKHITVKIIFRSFFAEYTSHAACLYRLNSKKTAFPLFCRTPCPNTPIEAKNHVKRHFAFIHDFTEIFICGMSVLIFLPPVFSRLCPCLFPFSFCSLSLPIYQSDENTQEIYGIHWTVDGLS